MKRAAVLLIAASWAMASPTLYAIRDNGFGAPQTLVSIEAPNGPVTDVRALGDGWVRYGGGLAWDVGAGEFYSFKSDSWGLLSLVSLTTSGGPTALIAGFGYGLPGGLAYTGTRLYGIVNDGFGDAVLMEFDLGGGTANPLFALGPGYLGGLAWNGVNSALYAIRSDSSGESSLMEIDLIGQSTNPLKTLGPGFYGGLAIDAATGVFWAVGSDIWGAGTLYDISSNDAPAAYAATGSGYLLAALSAGGAAPGGTTVPEPATFWLAGCGALAVVILKRK